MLLTAVSIIDLDELPLGSGEYDKAVYIHRNIEAFVTNSLFQALLEQAAFKCHLLCQRNLVVALITSEYHSAIF